MSKTHLKMHKLGTDYPAPKNLGFENRIKLHLPDWPQRLQNQLGKVNLRVQTFFEICFGFKEMQLKCKIKSFVCCNNARLGYHKLKTLRNRQIL